MHKDVFHPKYIFQQVVDWPDSHSLNDAEALEEARARASLFNIEWKWSVFQSQIPLTNKHPDAVSRSAIQIVQQPNLFHEPDKLNCFMTNPITQGTRMGGL